MLLPKDIIDKLYYYHHNNPLPSTDRVKVVYQGWLFKKTKIFDFSRASKYSEDGKYIIYTVADECIELVNQLKKVMKKNLYEEKDEEKDENEE